MRLFFSALLAMFAIGSLSAAPPNEPDTTALKLFKPLPEAMQSSDHPSNPAMVDLGRVLFYDPRLSKANDVSCNSCHNLTTYGVDNRAVSTGHLRQTGNRNSPTVYNAAGHFVQFWDGRAADVEAQAKGPVMNPVEMGITSEAEVVSRLKAIPAYVAMFRKAFPGQADPVTFDNMATAIGAFERGLLTPSRWDKYLKGDETALTAAEKAGFRQFVEAGCAGCHSGALVGGSLYQKAGLVKPWPNQSDLGRYAVTKQNTDKMLFKVPSLRNVLKTGPYFHNGETARIEEAVAAMGSHQTGASLDEQQIRSIVTWLGALTGEIPAAYIKQPVLPR